MDSYTPEAEDQQIFQMRQELVAHLKQLGLIQNAHIEAAFRAVPRHLFLPGIDVTRVYSDTVIATKTENGIPISSSSQPAIMAHMLAQLDVQPGHRVLEIGAGTGYNAALLAHMVGPEGSVVTIDIDEDLVESAQQHLKSAGYSQVHVVHADGGLGFAPLAPYDRIILTVGADDIPPAWREQLKPGGRLVLPFKLTQFHSILNFPLALDQISLGLRKTDNHLESYSMHAAGFMPLRGTFAVQKHQTFLLDKGLTFSSRKSLTQNMTQLLQQSYQDHPTGIQTNIFELWGLHIWLILQEPDYCELQKKNAEQKYQRLPALAQQNDNAQASYGLFSNSGLCLLYRALANKGDENGPTSGWEQAGELTIRSFGSDNALVNHLNRAIHAWDDAGRPFQWSYPQAISNLLIHAYPANRAHNKNAHELISPRAGSLIVFTW